MISSLQRTVSLVPIAYLAAAALLSYRVKAWSPPSRPTISCDPDTDRRSLLQRLLVNVAATSAISPLTLNPSPAGAALESTALSALLASTSSTTTTVLVPTLDSLPKDNIAVRLARRDASVLPNRLFNVSPPTRQVYPLWLRGEWMVSSEFAGFVFPSTHLAKEELIANAAIPGFQKCSIAATADIGQTKVGPYRWRVDAATGTEDRRGNYQTALDAYLGYPAVRTVIYNANPNRIGIDFVNYRTTNAERIELFVHAREAQEYTRATAAAPGASPPVNDRVFCGAEYIRQVTFGTGSTVGVPRQAVTNYAHYWTLQSNSWAATETWTGNLLTAAYLDPNDAMYFREPNLPVALYSHRLVAQRPVGTSAV